MSRPIGEPRLEIDRKNPDGNFYLYVTEGGKSRELSTFTRDREKAELFRHEWCIGRSRPKVAPPPDAVLITDVLNYYMVKRLPKVKAPKRIQEAVKAMLPFWENRYLSEITEDTCDEYVEKRDRAVETVRRELGVLGSAVKRYKKDGYVSQLVSVYRPESEDGRIRWLEPKEFIQLVKAARRLKGAAEHLPLFIAIGALTGQRKEAILSLTWNDVDLERGHIDWNPIGRRRTKKKRPRTAIPKRLVKYLQRRRAQYPDDTHVITYRGAAVADVKGSFRRAVVESGIPTDGYDRVMPHTLRHTCATWLMQKGVDKNEACAFLGMTIRTLERHYEHHHPDYQKGARDAF